MNKIPPTQIKRIKSYSMRPLMNNNIFDSIPTCAAQLLYDSFINYHKGMTRKELAFLLGNNTSNGESYVHDLMDGKIKFTEEILYKLDNIFNYPYGYFLLTHNNSEEWLANQPLQRLMEEEVDRIKNHYSSAPLLFDNNIDISLVKKGWIIIEDDYSVLSDAAYCLNKDNDVAVCILYRNSGSVNPIWRIPV